jgi:aminoglycoside phosphotransferase (APT) family kinase protein
MHPDQLTITRETVAALVAAQFPAWRDLAVEQVGRHGTVNAIFRIGAGLTARFPLRAGDTDITGTEAAAAALLVGRTRFATPEPVAIGAPGAGYPLPWSVQTWVPGSPVAESLACSRELATDLAELIGDIRAIDTGGATFSGTNRGGDLTSHDAWMDTCFARSSPLLDVQPLRRMWAQLRELPRSGLDVMNHGDLIPGNVLVEHGRLTGVIDVGGLAPADPALDLVCAWHLLDHEPRQALRAALRCSDVEWARGRAWALEQAMGLVWYYPETNPPMARLGRRTLRQLTSHTE